jgi:hypothetical protein
MPFDWRRLFGGGGGGVDDTSGMNPYQAQLQQTLNPPSQGNRLIRAGLAGLGSQQQQQGQGQQAPPFIPYQGLAGLGAPVQFGNRPAAAPPPVAPPMGTGGPNLSQNMPGSPNVMNMGMAGTPRSTRPVDPNDPYNMNSRNRMLGLA